MVLRERDPDLLLGGRPQVPQRSGAGGEHDDEHPEDDGRDEVAQPVRDVGPQVAPHEHERRERLQHDDGGDEDRRVSIGHAAHQPVRPAEHESDECDAPGDVEHADDGAEVADDLRRRDDDVHEDDRPDRERLPCDDVAEQRGQGQRTLGRGDLAPQPSAHVPNGPVRRLAQDPGDGLPALARREQPVVEPTGEHRACGTEGVVDAALQAEPDAFADVLVVLTREVQRHRLLHERSTPRGLSVRPLHEHDQQAGADRRDGEVDDELAHPGLGGGQAEELCPAPDPHAEGGPDRDGRERCRRPPLQLRGGPPHEQADDQAGRTDPEPERTPRRSVRGVELHAVRDDRGGRDEDEQRRPVEDGPSRVGH